MDGTTEPLIAVIGHPIAGNPTQFALERALRSLDMDWRVLSFDVRPSDVAAALEGFSVTGIAGVIVDASIRQEASRWHLHHVQRERAETANLLVDDPSEATQEGDVDRSRKRSESDIESQSAPGHPPSGNPAPSQPAPGPPAPSQPSAQTSHDGLVIDCLSRDARSRFIGSYEERGWLTEQFEQSGERRLWLGPTNEDLRLDVDAFETLPSPDAIAGANLIVLAGDADSVAVDPDDWNEDDGSTLVIDLTSGYAEQSSLRRRGYRVLSESDLRVGTLRRCLYRWTGRHASKDVIHDAIEEYLGV